VQDAADWMNAKALKERLRQEKMIEFNPRIWVFFAGKKNIAQVVYLSAKYDLAILKVDHPLLSWFRMAGAPRVSRGDEVWAVGYPGVAIVPISLDEIGASIERWTHDTADITTKFKDADFRFTLTKGNASRVFEETGGMRFIQHEATIRHGNSGGPLVLSNGIVVGINTWGLGGKNETDIYDALEISQLRHEIDDHVPDAQWDDQK
jgi:S1-C subfamily serine protease